MEGKGSEIGISSSVCAHRSGAESWRRTHGRGLLHLSSCLSSSTPLRLQHRLWAPVSFQSFCFSLIAYTLLFLFFFCHMSVYPPIPPFLYFWLTVAPPLSLASGSSHNQQHAWDSLHCLACFHITPRKLWIFAYKAFLLSFTAYCFSCTLWFCLPTTFSLLWRWESLTLYL